jgi:endoglucanase
MDRRSFIRRTGAITIGLSLAEKASLAAFQKGSSNKLPKWKGFNLTDFFSPNPTPTLRPTTEDHFRWMRDWGFDFVRIPIAYPYYLKFDRSKDITPEQVYDIDNQKLDEIDRLVAMGQKYGMHVCLNLHRAPGYCVNAGFHEPYNLWTDQKAQDAFNFHWGLWAKRHKNESPAKISFDLLNEPTWRDDMNDQHGKKGPVPGEVYYKVAKGAVESIRAANSGHLVIADGNQGGNYVIPELYELKIAQSCRGYNPHQISHYKAPWVYVDTEHLPDPKWPGQVGNEYLSRAMLETYYKPWIELAAKGEIGVHCGECGAYNKTPHDVFIAWFTDVTDILTTAGIGFALWNFIGDFGILNPGRDDVQYEDWHGYKLDRKLLDLIRKY